MFPNGRAGGRAGAGASAISGAGSRRAAASRRALYERPRSGGCTSERASGRACERSPSVLCACLVLVSGGAGWLSDERARARAQSRARERPRKLLSNPPKKCYFQNEEKTLPCLSQTGESFSSFWKAKCLPSSPTRACSLARPSLARTRVLSPARLPAHLRPRSPCGRSHSLSHPRVLSRPPLARRGTSPSLIKWHHLQSTP